MRASLVFVSGALQLAPVRYDGLQPVIVARQSIPSATTDTIEKTNPKLQSIQHTCITSPHTHIMSFHLFKSRRKRQPSNPTVPATTNSSTNPAETIRATANNTTTTGSSSTRSRSASNRGPHLSHQQQRPPQLALESDALSTISASLMDSLTSNRNSADRLKLILKNKIGLNLLNDKAIYNLYCADLFQTDEEDGSGNVGNKPRKRRGSEVDKYFKFSNLRLSKLNSNVEKTSPRSRSNSLRRIKSNQTDYSAATANTGTTGSTETTSHKSVSSHRLNPLNLLRFNKLEKKKIDCEDSGLTSVATGLLGSTAGGGATTKNYSDTPIAGIESQVEVQTNSVLPHSSNGEFYKRNHDLLRHAIDDECAISSPIKISIINSNDKVFIPTVVPDRRDGANSGVNRSLTSNINGAFDEELVMYEHRSRRNNRNSAADTGDVQEDHDVSNEGLEAGTDINADDENDNDESPNLHSFVIVVSVPKMNTVSELDQAYLKDNASTNKNFESSKSPVLQPLKSISSVLTDEILEYQGVDESSVSTSDINKSLSMSKTNTDLSNMLISLNLISKIFWKSMQNNNLNSIASAEKEEFLVGESSWKLDLLNDFNYFVPADENVDQKIFSQSFSLLSGNGVSVYDGSSEFFGGSSSNGISVHSGKKILTGKNTAQAMKKFKLKSIDEVKNEPYFNQEEFFKQFAESTTTKETFDKVKNSNELDLKRSRSHEGSEKLSGTDYRSKRLSMPVYSHPPQQMGKQLPIETSEKNVVFEYPAGDYIFVLPTIFDSSLPETVRAPHGSLNYKFGLSIKRFHPIDPLEKPSTGWSHRKYSFTKGLRRFAPLFSGDDIYGHNTFDDDEDNSPDFDNTLVKTSTLSKSISVNHAVNDNGGAGDEEADESVVYDSDNDSSYLPVLQNASGNMPQSIYSNDLIDNNHSNSNNAPLGSLKPTKKLVVKEELINKLFRLPVIRTPPALSSPLMKPVYVKRIWNNALSYEISFPSKFVRLNSEIPINIKLIPLCKHVFMKKLKINILERVSYVSKNLEYEYDEGKKNAKDHNIKEIVVPLAELRTKQEGGIALREDVLKSGTLTGKLNDKEKFNFDPKSKQAKQQELASTHSNSILSLCYRDAPPSEKLKSGSQKGQPQYENENEDEDENENDVIVDSDISIQLPLFFKGIKSHNHEYHTNNHRKSANSKNNQHNYYQSSNYHEDYPRRDFRTAVIGFPGVYVPPPQETYEGDSLPEDYLYQGKTEDDLWDEIKDSKTKIKYGANFLKVTRHAPRSLADSSFDFRSRHRIIPQLYPDSNNFNYISVSHRIQICFRISRKEEGDTNDKLHHYEVIIDAPIILVSDLCDDENVMLPPYLRATPGSLQVITDAQTSAAAEAAFNMENEFERLPTFEEATSTMNSPLLTYREAMEGDLPNIDDLVVKPLSSSYYNDPPVKPTSFEKLVADESISSKEPSNDHVTDHAEVRGPAPVKPITINGKLHPGFGGVNDSGSSISNTAEENELNSTVLLSPTSTNYSTDWNSTPASPRLGSIASTMMPLSRFNSMKRRERDNMGGVHTQNATSLLNRPGTGNSNINNISNNKSEYLDLDTNDFTDNEDERDVNQTLKLESVPHNADKREIDTAGESGANVNTVNTASHGVNNEALSLDNEKIEQFGLLPTYDETIAKERD